MTGVANRLHEGGVDITEAYDDIPSVIKDIKSTRKNIDKEFSVIFEQAKQAERVAVKVGKQPSA